MTMPACVSHAPTTRERLGVAAIAAMALALVSGCGNPAFRPDAGVSLAAPISAAPASFPHAAPNPHASAAYRWIDIIEEAAARRVDRVGARPTIISREMAITATAMYDAWAAYDEKAVGTRLGGALRRPLGQRTLENKETAIAYAAYRCLLFIYPEDAGWMTERMVAMGYDPADTSTDTATPTGIGNSVAAALIDYRAHDGANQLGDEAGSDGKPYSDYTAYACKNTADTCVDPDRWQPIVFDDGKGGKLTPGFLTPHWYKVKPFVLTSAEQFRPPGPPKVGSDALKKEVDKVLEYNRGLTLEQKALVEFMRDGPRSTGQSGHWMRFAEDVSRRDQYDLDRDVKLFFSVANICFDGFIACWETKRFYDSSRPWTLVRYYYKGQTVQGWAGPCKGVVTMPAEDWRPYSPSTFITPPFPGFPSGHATVSGASARILERFTGSDRFGAVERRKAGLLTEASCDMDVMQSVEGVAAKGVPKTEEEVLSLPTFTATAEMAALSRALGGYHIPYDNDEGLKLGRAIADYSWPKYQAFFDGTAATPDSTQP